MGDVPDVQGWPCNGGTWDAQALSVEPDCGTLGLVILYTKGVVTDWVDVVVTDLALRSLTVARIAELEAELGATMSELEIAHKHFCHGHAEVPGSSSFTLIRVARIGAS
ncbi:hypothetical protein ACWC4J_32680 [Streptomyces sp. NPDC001356]